MKRTYTVPVTANLDIDDGQHYSKGADILSGAVQSALENGMLTGKAPIFACWMTLKRRRDTYVRVERTESGRFYASVSIR